MNFMNIEVKHKLGETFWLMKDNRPVPNKVGSIYVSVFMRDSGEITEVSYDDISSGSRVKVNDENFYPTKEALLATL